MYICNNSYICIFVSLGTDIISQKNFTFGKFSPCPQKKSRDPMLDCMWEFLVENRSLARDI